MWNKHLSLLYLALYLSNWKSEGRHCLTIDLCKPLLKAFGLNLSHKTTTLFALKYHKSLCCFCCNRLVQWHSSNLYWFKFWGFLFANLGHWYHNPWACGLEVNSCKPQASTEWAWMEPGALKLVYHWLERVPATLCKYDGFLHREKLCGFQRVEQVKLRLVVLKWTTINVTCMERTAHYVRNGPYFCGQAAML